MRARVRLVRRPFLRVVLDPEVVERLLPRGSFYRFLFDNIEKLAADDVIGDVFSALRGRPSAIAPEHYLALILLRYHDNVSYEVASERGQFDVRWKAVIGKSPMDLTPTVSAASLQEFEDALKRRGRHEVLFQRTVTMAKDAGLLAKSVTVAQDSTSVTGRGAVKDTYNLLGDGLRRLLRALAKQQGTKPLALAEQFGAEELFRRSTKATANIDWSSPNARRGFLRRLVETAEAVIAHALSTAAGLGMEPHVVTAIDILRRVIAQDVQRDQDGTVSIRVGVAPDRLISIHDPEMRRGHKSQSEPFEGYKSHYTVEVTTGIVMATSVTGANVHDAIPSTAMAEQAEKASGCIVEKVIGDGAYGTEANRVAHAEAGRALVAKLPRARATGRYSKTEFVIDVKAQKITCPEGNTTTQFTRIRRRKEKDIEPSDIGMMQRFSFDPRVCGSCTRRPQCVPNGESKRRIDVGENELLIQAAREYALDPRFRADRVSRQIAERTVARFVQLGARQARVRGRDNVAAQITFIAVIANLTRLNQIARQAMRDTSSRVA